MRRPLALAVRSLPARSFRATSLFAWPLLLLLFLAGSSAQEQEPPAQAPSPPPSSAEAPAAAGWTMAGQNLSNTRHQPAETVIGADNVGRLRPKWTARLGGGVFVTPAVEPGGDGRAAAVYVPDEAGSLYRLDAETGAVVWRRQISDYTGSAGAISRTTPFIDGDRLILGDQPGCSAAACPGPKIFAVDKKTGDLVWARKVDDFPTSRITQSPVVAGGRVYVGVASGEEGLARRQGGYPCCSFRGKLVVLDAANGEVLDEFHTVPDVARFSGAAVWGSTAVVDAARGAVYFTTGNNYSVPEDVEKCVVACLERPCDMEEVRRCLSKHPGNHFNAVVALGLEDLELEWSFPGMVYDAWNWTCVTGENPQNCPEPAGPDFDFGQGPALFDAGGRTVVGAGQKSGYYWALDPASGEVVWQTEVGPGGFLGGSEWGSATDGERVYVAISNSIRNFWELRGRGTEAGFVINRGFWSALDAATGEILWQTPEPDRPVLRQPVSVGNIFGPQGPVTVANGVVYGGTTTPGGKDMFALRADNGNVAWSFASGGIVTSGAAVYDGVVYWGAFPPPEARETHSAYAAAVPDLTQAEGPATLYAFCVPGTPPCPGE